jgi:hypothetical protein
MYFFYFLGFATMAKRVRVTPSAEKPKKRRDTTRGTAILRTARELGTNKNPSASGGSGGDAAGT